MDASNPVPEEIPPQEILAFWREAGMERWFTADDAFDRLCRERFLSSHEQAAAGRYGAWESTPEGALALVILLDQMPRNIFRGTPRAWATDPLALQIAERAVERGFDREVDPALRAFFYLPFMHTESLEAQERSLALHATLDDPERMFWPRHHHATVARFGRFPHRNEALGRSSTPEELAFLKESDFRG